MDKIKQKIEEGWIHCVFIIEMLGKPKEHLEKTLKGYISALKKDKKVEILKEEYAEPEKDKDSKLYTIFVELEVLINGATKVVDFCFDYLQKKYLKISVIGKQKMQQVTVFLLCNRGILEPILAVFFWSIR